MGRPTKYNEAMHADIVRSLETGMSRTTAAELAGIDRETLEVWRGNKPAFSRDVTRALARAKGRASMTIAKAIVAGDVAAAFRYLALQERAEWSERAEMTPVGKDGGPIKTEMTITIRRVDAAGEPIPDSAIAAEADDDQEDP